MLSERVAAALPERSTFLRNYCTYAAYCSDAPDIFHLGVGLTIFSAAVAKTARMPWIAGRELVPNLYTLLVGPSRSARKTASLDIGIDLLREANAEASIPIPGSYEELIAQLRATPTGLMEYREFGHFLKTTQRGYGEPIRTVLMDLFDWPPNKPYTRNLKKGKTVVEAPIVLSMLAACSTDLLFSYTDTDAWVGGFFGRFVMLYGERSSFKMPIQDTWTTQMRDVLVWHLRQWSGVTLPQCGGFAPDAHQAFEQWSRFRDNTADSAPSRIRTFFSGASTLAAKIALLYAIDQHEPLAGAGWLISYSSLAKAVQFVDNLYIASITQIGDRLALGFFERDRQKIIDAIAQKGSPITRAELLRMTKVSTMLLDQVVDTLRESGEITQGQGGSGLTYKLSGGKTALGVLDGGKKSGSGEGEGGSFGA